MPVRAAPEADRRAREAEARDTDDERAMRAFQAGEREAFGRLVRRHERGVFNFCLRMLGSRPAAEDATQEVFLKVVRSADRWTPQAKVRTWMYRIARNHCIDEGRKAKHRETESLERPLGSEDSGGATVGERVADESVPAPDRGADSVRLRGALVRALASLSEEQREVFVMREQVGLPFKEIAEIVEVPENTAKSRMRYALEALRAALAAEGITREDAKP